jgi:hypothetical protein
MTVSDARHGSRCGRSTARKIECMSSTNAIKLQLDAEPLQLTLATRSAFKVSLTAANQGTEVVDPQLRRAELFVNGQRSFAWGLAIGNGRRPAMWYALPPGQSVTMTWSTLGESLFPGAGSYALELALDDLRPPPLLVQVLADQENPLSRTRKKGDASG